MASNTATQHSQAWLQAGEELRRAQIVTVNKGLSLTSNLYFGTHRSTYVTVVSVVTTALPLLHIDLLDQQTTSSPPNKASRWPRDRAKNDSRRLKLSKTTENGEVGDRKPYAAATSLLTKEQQTLALLREQRAFMKSLHHIRSERAQQEHDAALLIQRVRRGIVLRRQFLGIRQILIIRKRIRQSILQATKGTAIVLQKKNRRGQMQTKRNKAALKIQNTFRVWGARRMLAKLKYRQRCEQRHRCAVSIQKTWRASTARWVVAKLRVQLIETNTRHSS